MALQCNALNSSCLGAVVLFEEYFTSYGYAKRHEGMQLASVPAKRHGHTHVCAGEAGHISPYYAALHTPESGYCALQAKSIWLAASGGFEPHYYGRRGRLREVETLWDQADTQILHC